MTNFFEFPLFGLSLQIYMQMSVLILMLDD
jgi:hypothetical protein